MELEKRAFILEFGLDKSLNVVTLKTHLESLKNFSLIYTGVCRGTRNSNVIV
jgi:hypothetical protein